MIETWNVSTELFDILAMTVTDDALTIIEEITNFNGFEAWRHMVARYASDGFGGGCASHEPKEEHQDSISREMDAGFSARPTTKEESPKASSGSNPVALDLLVEIAVRKHFRILNAADADDPFENSR